MMTVIEMIQRSQEHYVIAESADEFVETKMLGFAK